MHLKEYSDDEQAMKVETNVDHLLERSVKRHNRMESEATQNMRC